VAISSSVGSRPSAAASLRSTRVILFGGANQAERALLDQVEERQPLVAVVLGDRHDQAQVGLDHVLLGLCVAALDALRELDLLGRGQERHPADVAQEDLQQVGSGRPRAERRGGPTLLHLVLVVGGSGDLDAELLEPRVQLVDRRRVQLELLDQGVELALRDRPRLLGAPKQRPHVVMGRRRGVRRDHVVGHPQEAYAPQGGAVDGNEPANGVGASLACANHLPGRAPLGPPVRGRTTHHLYGSAAASVRVL
jgi:hypothetical protein